MHDNVYRANFTPNLTAARLRRRQPPLEQFPIALRIAATVAAGAVFGDPQSNGGSGAYCNSS